MHTSFVSLLTDGNGNDTITTTSTATATVSIANADHQHSTSGAATDNGNGNRSHNTATADLLQCLQNCANASRLSLVNLFPSRLESVQRRVYSANQSRLSLSLYRSISILLYVSIFCADDYLF